MKVIKIKKKDVEGIRKLDNKIYGYNESIEHLSHRLGELSDKLWTVINKKYPQTKNMNCHFNNEDYTIEIFDKR